MQAGPGDDEVLETGRPHARRTSVLAVLAALLAGGLWIATHGGSAKRSAAPSSPASTARTSRPNLGPPPPLARDVAIGHGGAWVLEDDALLTVAGARTLRRIPLPELAGATPDAAPRLVLDPAAPLLWVVVEGGAHARLVKFSTEPLRRLRVLTWNEPVQFAAAYRGHLFLSTGLGTADLAPGASRPVFVPGLSPAVGPIAVDPSRQRIVLMDLGSPTDVWTYRPGGRAVEAAAPLPFAKGSVAVVAGAIWVGGYGPSGAVLERLDPTTLRPLERSPAQAGFDPGAELVGTGSRVLWARSGGGGPFLWCLDASTGKIAQTFTVPPGVNGVASDRSGAVVASDGGAMELLLSGCPG